GSPRPEPNGTHPGAAGGAKLCKVHDSARPNVSGSAHLRRHSRLPTVRTMNSSDPQSRAVNSEGAWAQRAEAELPTRRLEEEIERNIAFGLEAAPSIVDRTISTFVRGELPHFAGEMGT